MPSGGGTRSKAGKARLLRVLTARAHAQIHAKPKVAARGEENKNGNQRTNVVSQGRSDKSDTLQFPPVLDTTQLLRICATCARRSAVFRFLGGERQVTAFRLFSRTTKFGETTCTQVKEELEQGP